MGEVWGLRGEGGGQRPEGFLVLEWRMSQPRDPGEGIVTDCHCPGGSLALEQVGM